MLFPFILSGRVSMYTMLISFMLLRFVCKIIYVAWHWTRVIRQTINRSSLRRASCNSPAKLHRLLLVTDLNAWSVSC